MKALVLGHKGLVGSAIAKSLTKNNIEVIAVERSVLDLQDTQKTFDFLRDVRPDWVFLSAAKVGGIVANNSYPVEFLLENLKIQNNVIEGCFRSKVPKLLFLGSSCIYPKETTIPIQENSLLTSPLEKTNEAYALAKIVGLKLCHYYNQQYGSNFLTVMPCNVYGPNDNYHLENSHVLPALIRKVHEAKERGEKVYRLWGTGNPRREFIFSEDLADACFFLMKNYDAKDIGEHVNIGTGKDVSILELTKTVMDIVGFEGEIEFDLSRPDGTFQKTLDVSKLTKLGFVAKTELKEGIKKAYQDFLQNKHLRF